MDLAERKSRLRREMAARRGAVARDAAEAAGEAVAERLAALPEFAAARTLALYAALSGELPTRPLFELARRRAKAVRMPRIEGDELVFAGVERWEELRPGRYGVLQPPPEARACPPGDLVVVPGVAFDREGHRLGRGGGYYDRAFTRAAARDAVRVGVAFELQMVEAVPHGRDDQRMNLVVTESGVYRRAGGRA